jgi:hypothetical protein
MKLSIFTGFGFTSAIVLAMALTACGKKDDGNAGAVNARGSIYGVPGTPVNPAGYVAKAEYVVSQTNFGSVSNFQQNVIDMLSAQFDPQAVGAIDNQSVVLAAYLEMGATGQINPQPSRMRLWITDSYARDQVKMSNGEAATPFYIEINGAAGGSITGNQFNVTFRDANREFVIQGSYTGNIAVGSVSFRNLKDFSNSNLKSASPMGYFSTETCALLNCRTQ